MSVITVNDIATIYGGLIIIKVIGTDNMLWFGAISALKRDNPYRKLEIHRMTSVKHNIVTLYVSQTTDTN